MNRFKFALTLIILLSNSSFALQAKVQNADDWKVQYMQKGAESIPFMNAAEFVMTAPLSKNGVVPTIIVNKISVTGIPKTTGQWRDLLLNGRQNLKPLRERILTKQGRSRYIAEMEDNSIPQAVIRLFIMVEIVNDEAYIFSYQAHPGVYQAHYPDIANLYKQVEITLE